LIGETERLRWRDYGEKERMRLGNMLNGEKERTVRWRDYGEKERMRLGNILNGEKDRTVRWRE